MRSILLLSSILILSDAGINTTQAAPPESDQVKLLQDFVSELVKITPGKNGFPTEFMMGNKVGSTAEKPTHTVKMKSPFAIAKYEVPQNLYESIMGSNPSRWKGPRNSVEMMTRAEAIEFCKKLTALLHQQKLIPPNQIIRLPTEAEWEYCCRAGTSTLYSFGGEARKPGDQENNASLLDDYAWHTGNAAGNDPPVGAKKPNPWGLYDMHGYLREMVLDDWHDNYQSAPTDGSAWKKKNAKQYPVRGGSWKDRWPLLTSSWRQPAVVGARDDALGFRCVRSGK